MLEKYNYITFSVYFYRRCKRILIFCFMEMFQMLSSYVPTVFQSNLHEFHENWSLKKM